jgi:hypothetical protein
MDRIFASRRLMAYSVPRPLMQAQLSAMNVRSKRGPILL